MQVWSSPRKGAESCYHVHMLIIKALCLEIKIREVLSLKVKASQMGFTPPPDFLLTYIFQDVSQQNSLR